MDKGLRKRLQGRFFGSGFFFDFHSVRIQETTDIMYTYFRRPSKISVCDFYIPGNPARIGRPERTHVGRCNLPTQPPNTFYLVKKRGAGNGPPTNKDTWIGGGFL